MPRIVYRPTAEWIQSSAISKLLAKTQASSFEELLKKSQKRPEWFWTTIIEDSGIQFRKPYEKLIDGQLPWTKWASGGELSIVENCIDRHLKAFAHKPALIFESDDGTRSTTWTYADLARESSFVANALLERGAQLNDRVALLMPMSLEMVASFFGALRAGLTVIPIFSGYGADAIASRIQDSKARYVCIQSKTTRRGKEIPVRKVLDEVLKTCPSVEHVFEWNRDDFLNGRHSASDVYQSVAKPSEMEALFLYTSGTTGQPKACVHTSFGVLATTAKELRYSFDVRSDDKFFWYTDIGWMMGPWELFGVLQFGATVVLYEGVPDFPQPDRLWQIIDKHAVTHLGISPTAIRVLKKLGDEWFAKYSLKSLRILGSTGEPWDEESWMWYFQKIGKGKCPILNISGGTEIMGCLLMPTPLSALKPCSLGQPALGADVEAWNEDGQKINSGIGHLVCLNALPSMTKGFLNSPERYIETYFTKFGDKVWYHGDWAYIDEDGFWFLRGRSDDTIKIAGKRVGPNEFESGLMEDSRVAEAAAIGVPDTIKGESVYCFVVLKNETNERELIRLALQKKLSDKMGKAFAPEKILFSSALPKTRSGKILRGLIRKITLRETYDSSAVDNEIAIEAIKNAQ